LPSKGEFIISCADGSGATSGILNAPDPGLRILEMAEAIVRAAAERDAAGGAA